MTLLPVTLQGPYFQRGEKPFIPIGAHWVPAKTGLRWPVEWDPTELEADFAKMAELGFNTVRFDLFWAWFEPRPGDYNPEAFQQLDEFIRLAKKYSIYLHPALFVGGEVGEAFWDVPWRQGRHPHADADMLRLQTDHAAEFARRYTGEPAILAWDLTDEPPFWIVSGDTTDAMAINWTRLIAGALRRYDPAHLRCVGTNVEDINHGPFRPDTIAGEVDFFSVHPYSIYTFDRFPDPMLSERGTYAGAFQTALSGGVGKSVMIHEFGASSAQYDPERIAAFDRVTFYSGLANGANGFLAWCFTDAAPGLYQQAPYRLAPHETQFGLTTWDRKDRPRGQVLREFSHLLGQMDFADLRSGLSQAAIIIPHEWAKPHGDMSHAGLTGSGAIPYASTQSAFDEREPNLWLTQALLNTFILCRRAGLQAGFPREYGNWQTYPLLLLPSPLTSTERNLVHVHTTFWEAARGYVEAGGILYASLCADTAIPDMESLFGARLSDHISTEAVKLTFQKPFGLISRGTEFHFQADPSRPQDWPATIDVGDGEVLAIDSFGRPALISHECGKGKTLLSTYPLEHYLGSQPAAFEIPQTTHLLYRSLAEWAGITPVFSTDAPGVEAGVLTAGSRGYVILANHQPDKKMIKLQTSLNLKEVKKITNDGNQDLTLQHNSIQMEVRGYDGAIVEWNT